MNWRLLEIILNEQFYRTKILQLENAMKIHQDSSQNLDLDGTFPPEMIHIQVSK